jgi:hypothetical protein
MEPAVTPRILLGLKAGEPPQGSIALATHLAVSLRAAVHGLLIEEQGLIDAAALPFTRIAARTGTHAPVFTSISLERAFGLSAQACRDMIGMMAQAAHVPWTMQRERGEFASTLRERAKTGDIVIMPGPSGGAAAGAALTDIRLIASRASAVVMMARVSPSWQLEAGPVVAIDEGDLAGARTISLAAKLAVGMNRPLHVIVIAGTAAEAAAIKQRACAAAARAQLIRFHWLRPGHEEAFALKLRMLAPSLVVADIEGELMRDDAAVREFQRASKAPMLLLASSTPPQTV